MFMDGRTHVYGPEVLRDFLEVTEAGPRWQVVLDKWQVQTILALRSSALTEMLLARGGWRLVFTEREAVVFVRDTDANRSLLVRLGQLSREGPVDGETDVDDPRDGRGDRGSLVSALAPGPLARPRGEGVR